MKFDIVRAWKDEAYRQALSPEERAALPANPIEGLELSDVALEHVRGGDDGMPYVNEALASAATARATMSHARSFALICEINIYSIDIKILQIDLIQIGNAHTRVCVRQG